MPSFCKRIVALAFGLFVSAPCLAADPTRELLNRIPDQANAVVILDVKAVHQSPLGKRQNWAKAHERMTLGGLSGTPPTITHLVVGAQVNPATLENTWEVALAYLDRDIFQADLVKAVGGKPDSVAGHEIVVSPQNALYVRFHSRVIGMMRPANRQAMSRWVGSAWKAPRMSLSPYLRDAVETMPRGAQCLMAVELTDVLDENGLQERMKKSPALSSQRAQVGQLAKLFSGLNGFTVNLRVDNAINGQLRLDFGTSATAVGPVAKPLLMEALGGMGAYIEDLDQWQARTEGNAVLLEGKLTRRGARQVLTPFLHPAQTPVFEVTSESSDPKAAASQRYFRSVRTLLDDLKGQKSKSYSQLSYWHQQFADKIDALPILNVDEDLLKYGASVSTTLRGLGNLANDTALEQKGIAANAREALVNVPTGNYYYGYARGWGWGASGWAAQTNPTTVNNYGLTQNLIAKGVRDETALRTQTWQNIDSASTDIRQKMVAKYKVEF